MTERTYFIPLLKDGKVVTEDIFTEDVPDDGLWKFSFKELDDEQRRLAHLAPGQNIADLYHPDADEATDYTLYTDETQLLEGLRDLAEYNTAARDRTVTPE